MKVLIASILFLSIINLAQENHYSSFTTKEARVEFRNMLLTEKIIAAIKNEITDSTEKNLIDAFWAAELILENSELVKKSIRNVLINYEHFSDNLLRSTIQAAYTLFPNDFKEELIELAKVIKNEKLFAMSVLHLQRQGENEKILISMLESRYPDYAKNPILLMLNYKLEEDNKYLPPPIIELLKFNSFDMPVLFVFQRKDRDFIGRVILRDAQGNFVKENNKLFSIPILARAISNLPGFLTNGNTPQGIFSIQGTAVSSNVFIGETENLQTVLPFEVSTNDFFHQRSKNDSVFSIELYKNLLPEAWQNYFPIYEAFYAGNAGRNEIILHGTTVDTSYYTGKNYAPYTPTLGCLCTLEIWDENSGMRKFSDQQRLMDKFNSLGEKKGFLIVVELDNKKSPISEEEIEDLINKYHTNE